MNNCAIVLLGVTGDLAKRKLIPSLYRLIAGNKLTNFVLIGAAFEDVTIEDILEQTRPFIKGKVDQKAWDRLKERSSYQQLDFKKEQDFNVLATFVSQQEKKYGLEGNRLIYLAVAASFFSTITKEVAQSGLAKKLSLQDKVWHKIVYEKPFGHDLESAREINAQIAQSFNEHQIYRIDHYLTKELVSNIALIRFTNCVFEPLWNNRFIDNVQIILSETIGMEGRGAYYDHFGALRDVVQNHMLELMALITMEAPEKLTGEFIRNERAQVLKKVQVVDAIIGQYKGYTKEQSVVPTSKTETFATAYLTVNNPRWAGVPFYLKTGKGLDKKETVIHIKFKQVDCLLTKNCPSESNYLTIRLHPDESFTLVLNARKTRIDRRNSADWYGILSQLPFW